MKASCSLAIDSSLYPSARTNFLTFVLYCKKIVNSLPGGGDCSSVNCLFSFEYGGISCTAGGACRDFGVSVNSVLPSPGASGGWATGKGSASVGGPLNVALGPSKPATTCLSLSSGVFVVGLSSGPASLGGCITGGFASSDRRLGTRAGEISVFRGVEFC